MVVTMLLAPRRLRELLQLLGAVQDMLQEDIEVVNAIVEDIRDRQRRRR